ncbi:hypothetical protein Amn_24120 [Aminobacter sp. Y103A]|uniref:hypothetical protein n=1 Tax=Aminobacter sp. Y103A TaxID=1870862 RepID=UPI002572E1F1|nr:hypothetical protein [Aminobacter sp. SS-2016]BBD37532.1 hypothetical protein Amn_24120 [Aminobacter sp. SS-2016]
MSAFYALCHDDRVELLTDGARYHDDGTLVEICRKVWTSPCLPLAVTGRGGGAVEAYTKAIVGLSALGTFDDVIESVQRLVTRSTRFDIAEPAEVVIAGISETRGPCILYFATTNAYGLEGFEPFVISDAGREFGGGAPLEPSEAEAIRSRGSTLRELGVDLFEAMRRKKGKNPARPDLPDHYGIGGHVDLTVVSSGGCTVERLHTWDDEVGKPIDPYVNLAPPAVKPVRTGMVG